jgi:hypothetical protein
VGVGGSLSVTVVPSKSALFFSSQEVDIVPETAVEESEEIKRCLDVSNSWMDGVSLMKKWSIGQKGCALSHGQVESSGERLSLDAEGPPTPRLGAFDSNRRVAPIT